MNLAEVAGERECYAAGDVHGVGEGVVAVVVGVVVPFST